MARAASLKADWTDLDNHHLSYLVAPGAGMHLEIIRVTASACFGAKDENPIHLTAHTSGEGVDARGWGMVLTPDCPSKTIWCAPKADITAATGMTATDEIYGVPLKTNDQLTISIGSTPPNKYDSTKCRVDYYYAIVDPVGNPPYAPLHTPSSMSLQQVTFRLDNTNYATTGWRPPYLHASELIRTECTAHFGKGDLPERPIAVNVCGGAGMSNGGGGWLTPENPSMTFDFNAPPKWAAADDKTHGNVYGLPDNVDEVWNAQFWCQMPDVPTPPLRYADSYVEMTFTLADVTTTDPIWLPTTPATPCVAWLEVDRFNYAAYVPVTNGRISSLQDITGNGHSPACGDFTHMPAYTISGMSGYATFSLARNTFLYHAFAQAQPTHIFLVARWQKPAVGQTSILLEGVAVLQGTFYAANNSSTAILNNGTSLPTVAAADGDWHLIEIINNGVTSSVLIDGGVAVTGNSGAAALDAIDLGGRGTQLNADADVYGLAIYGAELVGADLTNIRAYWKAKCALSWITLP